MKGKDERWLSHCGMLDTEIWKIKEVDSGGLGIKKLWGLGFEGIFSDLLKSLRLMVGLIIEGRTSDVRIKVFTEREAVAGKTEDNGIKWRETI